MQIKNSSNQVFTATLSSKLRQELQKQAIEQGGQSVLALSKKIKEVNNWGHKCSILKLSCDEFSGQKFIELQDNSVKKQFSIPIKSDGSLLDFFMNMSKGFFIDKEMQFRTAVNKKFVYK